MSLVELGDTVDLCADSFLDVTRYTEVEPVSGNPQPRTEEIIPKVPMSITPLKTEELMQLEEGARTEGAQAVIATTVLNVTDEFTYRGARYRVDVIEDYLDTGGFFRYLCPKAEVEL